MTEDRKTELLDKINMVATNDPKASPDPEFNIKVSLSEVSAGSYLVDILVHYVVPIENDYDKMDVNFAACKGLISNANQNSRNDACFKLS